MVTERGINEAESIFNEGLIYCISTAPSLQLGSSMLSCSIQAVLSPPCFVRGDGCFKECYMSQLTYFKHLIIFNALLYCLHIKKKLSKFPWPFRLTVIIFPHHHLLIVLNYCIYMLTPGCEPCVWLTRPASLLFFNIFYSPSACINVVLTFVIVIC